MLAVHEVRAPTANTMYDSAKNNRHDIITRMSKYVFCYKHGRLTTLCITFEVYTVTAVQGLSASAHRARGG